MGKGMKYISFAAVQKGKESSPKKRIAQQCSAQFKMFTVVIFLQLNVLTQRKA